MSKRTVDALRRDRHAQFPELSRRERELVEVDGRLDVGGIERSRDGLHGRADRSQVGCVSKRRPRFAAEP